MHFKSYLSASVLLAAYAQARSRGESGKVAILQEQSTAESKILCLEGLIPTLRSLSFQEEANDHWKFSQVDETENSERIVTIHWEGSSPGGYVNCTSTNNDTPCELEESEDNIQTFVEYSESGGMGLIYTFLDQKTKQPLYTTEEGRLALSGDETSREPYASVFFLEGIV